MSFQRPFKDILKLLLKACYRPSKGLANAFKWPLKSLYKTIKFKPSRGLYKAFKRLPIGLLKESKGFLKGLPKASQRPSSGFKGHQKAITSPLQCLSKVFERLSRNRDRERERERREKRKERERDREIERER